MDLTRRLRAWAHTRPRVLVVEGAGADPLRWSVESDLDRRGWPFAQSPADTDLLLVLGTPGPHLSAAVDLLWEQVPRPRHRLDITEEHQVPGLLDTAVPALTRAARNREVTTPQAMPDVGGSDAAGADRTAHDASGTQDSAAMTAAHRGHHATDHTGHGGEGQAGHAARGHGTSEAPSGGGHEGMGHAQHEGLGRDGHASRAGHADHSGHDTGGRHCEHSKHPEPAAGHDHAGHSSDPTMAHAAHGGGGHTGHQMHHGGAVAGLNMARTGPDRDGLELDVLRVSLGPVLPGWPTGLVLRAELQGDVVVAAQLSWADDRHNPHAGHVADPRRTALDRLASFLVVAGWMTAARDARRARDGLGSPDSARRAKAAQQARAVGRRVCRSRILAWTVRGAGRIQHEPGGVAGGEIMDRIRRWCDIAAGDHRGGLTAVPMSDVTTALAGAELGTVRLIVASVELDRTAPVHGAEATHA